MRIGFNLAIFEDHDQWASLFCKNGRTPWAHKAWEIQGHNLGWGDLITFEFSWTRKTDHAGVSLKLGLFGYVIEGQIYDSRHWDSETNDYVVYDEAYYQRNFSTPAEESAVSKADMASAVEVFLKSDQGQRLIDERVSGKIEEQKQAKLDKQARGEAYRAANLARQQSKDL
jgi:hypothetical protein